jgi:arabinogalactan oligomer/maltooligosaccharide transport system permease protein
VKSLLRFWAVHGALVFATFLAVYPVLFVVRMALSPGGGLQMGLSPLPTEVSAANLVAVVATKAGDGSWLFGRQLASSLLVAGATALTGVGIAATAGYAMSRWSFPGREGLGRLFLLTQMFPTVVMATPLYLLLDVLHLLDSSLGLVLCYATSAIPFATWNLKGYFDTVPRELEEAAMIDGASRWTTFVTIILPLARPALVVTGLFAFMGAWNEFILAATLLGDERVYTLPVVLNGYVGEQSAQWGSFAAGAILVSLPVVALFFVLQRHLVEGLTAGSVKG